MNDKQSHNDCFIGYKNNRFQRLVIGVWM